MSAAIQMLRPSLAWVWVQSEQPFEVPQAVLDVPGVRAIEPEPGYACWRVEVPETAWTLPVVGTWFSQLFASQPTRAVEAVVLRDGRRALYQHQRDGAAFLARARGAILGDAMGLGKTTTAIAAAHAVRTRFADPTGVTRPALIVGPKTVRGVWRAEVEAVVGGEQRFVALTGTDPTDAVQRFWLERADWIFIHFDIVHAWWSQILLRRPLVAIVDEAHLVRNGRTRRGKAAALALSASAHRYLLTGTPILNRVGELWHLLNLATGPFMWGSPRDFRCRYAGAVFDGFGYRDTEPTNVEELHRRVEGCYLRRTLGDVAFSLPSLTRQVVEVELDAAQRAKYAELLEGRDLRAVVRSILNGSASRKTLAWLSALRKITSRAKFDATVAEVQSAREADESVVVFTWERAMVERIVTCVGPAKTRACWQHVVHGGVSQSERENAVAAFQNDGGVLGATIEALSVGVTLHRARIVVMHDLDWVPANMLQAEARVYRIGQSRPVLSKWMIAQGTLDEMFVRAVKRKGETMRVMGDAGGAVLADVLGEDELDESLERVLRWAAEG